jgi:geranylgeranyl pyrophosphate synthase
VPFHSLAAAVDMLHTATLIHDDLVDRAPLRRGHETLHTIWPPGATVLAGDYLLGRATSLIAELEHPRILKAFSFSGAIEAALAGAHAHALRSQEVLATLPDGVSRQTLCSLAEYVVERRA